MKFTNPLFILVFVLSAISNSYAEDSNSINFPVGLWDTYHYKINDRTGVTSRIPMHLYICIQPDGTVQSINSDEKMGGRWTRIGNNILLSGNGSEIGGTGNLTLSKPYKAMTGEWQSWSIKNPHKVHTIYTSEWKLKSTTTCIVP